MYKPLMRWARERMRGMDRIKLPELAEEAIEKFKNDRAFLKACVYPAVYSELSGLVAMTRKSGQSARAMETSEEKGERCASATDRLEWTPRGYVRITAMTYVDLTEAMAPRRARIEGETRGLLLLEKLSMRVPNDGKTTVGDCFDPAQLASIIRQYEEGTQTVELPAPAAAEVSQDAN